MRLGSVVALVLVGGMVTASASGASTPKFDARWSALQTCLTNTEQGSLSNGIHPDGFVATTSPGHLQLEGSGGFAAALIYEGTFSKAETQARRTKKDLDPAVPVGHGAGFAVGNVTFYFTTLAASVQEEVLTSCLTATYAGQPRWPTRLNLNTLPYSNHGGTPEP